MRLKLGNSVPSVDIRYGLDLLVLDLVKKRREDTPRLGQLVASHEMDLTSEENVKNESFVSVRHVNSLLEEEKEDSFSEVLKKSA